MENGVDELLERLHQRRQLPPKSERRLIRESGERLPRRGDRLASASTAVQKLGRRRHAVANSLKKRNYAPGCSRRSKDVAR